MQIVCKRSRRKRGKNNFKKLKEKKKKKRKETKNNDAKITVCMWKGARNETALNETALLSMFFISCTNKLSALLET